MYSLMIVDDEAEIRNGINNYIPWKEMGFQVVYSAKDGSDALAYIEQHPVDCVLCDVNMPIMDGMRFAQIAHENGYDFKIVFLSGYSEFSYAQAALRYKVEDYLLKPIKLTELNTVFSRIKAYLDERAQLGDDAPASMPLGYNENLIRVVKDYILSNFRDATLNNAAKLAHMSPSYFSSFFKRINGIGFSDYLIQVKMEQAARLLQDPQYKTYEISEMVGYRNPKNFTRTFKNYYGKVPREYRK